MNQNSSLIKTIIVVITIGAIGFLGFSYMSRDVQNSNDITVTQSGETASIGSEVLSALNQLRQLNLDSSIFSDQTFQSLKDFSRAIPQQSIGRHNPFAPAGSDPVGTVNTVSISTSSSSFLPNSNTTDTKTSTSSAKSPRSIKTTTF